MNESNFGKFSTMKRKFYLDDIKKQRKNYSNQFYEWHKCLPMIEKSKLWGFFSPKEKWVLEITETALWRAKFPAPNQYKIKIKEWNWCLSFQSKNDYDMHNEAICKGLENPKFYYDVDKHKFGADPLGPKTKGIPFSWIKIGWETRRQS